MRNREDVSTSSVPHEPPLGFLLVSQLSFFKNMSTLLSVTLLVCLFSCDCALTGSSGPVC